jgi:hypothetical protein
MHDNDLLARFRKFYDVPEADDAAVLEETEARFLKQPWETRKFFVDGLEQEMLNDEIGMKERGRAPQSAPQIPRVARRAKACWSMSLPEQSRGNRLLLGIEQRLHSESSLASTFPRGSYPLTYGTALVFLRNGAVKKAFAGSQQNRGWWRLFFSTKSLVAEMCKAVSHCLPR